MSRRLINAALIASLVLNALLFSWVVSTPSGASSAAELLSAPTRTHGGALPDSRRNAAVASRVRSRPRTVATASPAPRGALPAGQRVVAQGERSRAKGSDASESPLDFLPLETRARIEELERRMSAELLAASNAGTLDATTWARMADDRRAAVEELLTDEERFEYELRTSERARSLRALLNDVEVTDDEFHRLYVITRDFDEATGRSDSGDRTAVRADESPAERDAARRQAEGTRDEGFRMVLGDERYRRYRAEESLRSSSLRRVAIEHELPRESVYQVLELADGAREAADRIREEARLTTDSRQEALATLRMEMERDVALLVGEDAARSYLETDLGLRAMTSPIVPESVRSLLARSEQP